jgi:uncharacterized membrane protein
MDIAALLGFLFSNPLVQGWFASRLTAGVKAAPFIPIQGGAKLRAVAVLLSVVASLVGAIAVGDLASIDANVLLQQTVDAVTTLLVATGVFHFVGDEKPAE